MSGQGLSAAHTGKRRQKDKEGKNKEVGVKCGREVSYKELQQNTSCKDKEGSSYVIYTKGKDNVIIFSLRKKSLI
jgi:hypothetical protein